MIAKFWPIAALVTLVVAATGIGVFYYVGDHANPSGNGTLAIEVDDARCSNCSHVWVTFTSVAVHESNVSSSATGGGWVTLNVSGATVDLAALNGSALAKTIGVASLGAGHYEQVRLTVSKAVVVLSNGMSLNATIPNATSANIDCAFEINSGVTSTNSIDIDLASSVHIAGGGPTIMAVFTPHIGSVVVV